MGCLICKRTVCKTSTLNACCGDSSITIKDKIIEFVGDSIAGYLDDSKGVCKICQDMLDEIVKSKLEMLRSIRLTAELYVPKLGKYWTFCSKYADYNTFEFNGNTTPEPRSRDPTPIMSVTRTKMYNGPVEQIFETREGLKAELRNDYGRGKIGLKEGRINRSKSAILHKLKQDMKDRTQRGTSEPQDRSISVASNMSVFSSASNVRERDTFNDQLTAAYREELRKTCKCPYEECKDLNLEENYFEYTNHMIQEHNAKPYFKCDPCGFEYLKKEHLKIHSLKHDIFPVLCGICGNQTPNVSAYQLHADKHLASSFKCIVCDMAFCTKKECNKHIFSNHRQRRRIFLRRKASQPIESIILKQIDHKKPNILIGTTIATSVDPVNNNKCREMKITCNEPERFKEKTFPERYFLHRHQAAEWDPDAFSLADSVAQSENLDERIQAELAKSGKMSDLYKVSNRPNSAREKSGRTTPFQRSETPFSEDLDMPPFVGSNNYYKTSRDLESRSTEVAKYMNGDEDSDANSETQEVESDFEIENQYLDGNTFLSSIPSPYSSTGKS